MNDNQNAANPAVEEEENLADRVKVMSPGRLVAKRFFRNRLAVTGLSVLVFMFLFSFVGGFLSPYEEDQLFYRYEEMSKEYAGVVKNEEFRFMAAEGKSFNSVVQAQAVLAITQNKTEFSYSGVNYQMTADSEDLYSVYSDGELLGIAYKTGVTPADADTKLSCDFQYAALKALGAEAAEFEVGGEIYVLADDGTVTLNGKEFATVSEYIIQPVMPDVFLDRNFKEEIINAIESGKSELEYVNGDTSVVYTIVYDAASKGYYYDNVFCDFEKELKTVFIVSDVELKNEKAPEGVFCETESGIGVKVEQASGNKCDRCWAYSCDCEADGEGFICARCKKIVNFLA